jgi:hypothetical protein
MAFSWLHPILEFVWQYLSVKNKLISGDEDITFLGEDKEWLILYSKKNWKPNITITSFWTPSSTYESFCWWKFWICKSRRLDYVFHLWVFDGETLKSKKVSRTRYRWFFLQKQKAKSKWKAFHIIILSDHEFNSILHS